MWTDLDLFAQSQFPNEFAQHLKRIAILKDDGKKYWGVFFSTQPIVGPLTRGKPSWAIKVPIWILPISQDALTYAIECADASGRLIRAKEMMTWFKALPGTTFKQDHTGITDFYWFVYQEDPWGQGHVCIH